MLSRSLIFFMLLADLSFHGHEDTVHLSMYSPLILFNRENILFASSPMSCTVSKEGTFTISLLLLKGIKRERIKRVLLILLVTLLLQCGDIENNPGPLDDSQPTAKRPRTAICVCSKCYGAERDYRTVERHMKEAYSAQTMTTSETVNPNYSEIEDDPSSSRSVVHQQTGPTSTPPTSNYLLSQNQPDIHVTITSRKIKEFVMKEVRTKLIHGLSVSTTEDHLRNAATLLGEEAIPTKWNDVLRFLKSMGYTDPRHYKVCLEQDHSTLLETTDTACSICSKPASQCIDYYVLGLNFREWFLTAESCDRLMSHWNDRDQWFGKSVDYDHPGVTELWHGSRFRELSWFWNSNEAYVLPDWCPFCREIISASMIQEASTNGEAITCQSCMNTFEPIVRETAGDPRNQVIIIHEDGWNSFSTSQSTMAAITITHGCMSKSERSNADYARVYSFIPAGQMPTDSPHKYDAFLKPLINELEELFIEGEEVYFNKEIPGVCEQDSCPKLRVLPLLVTADSKAHHEIGLTSAGGHKGCRRCQVGGTYVPERRHYYYGNFRQRFWNPYPPRTAEEDRINGKAADRATTVAERKRICRETGVTGESLFYRLYDLCKFDPVKDLTIDAMHAIVLNLIRTEASLLLADLGRNSSLRPSERDPSNGGVLDCQSLAIALEKVEWTPELKDGRVPAFCKDGQRLSHWKAEEFSKFILVAPVMLRNLIPKKCYDCFCLLKDIYDLVYSKRLRIQGWYSEHHSYFKKLLWLHAIVFEDLYGLSACTENLEYSLHMTEDIHRHSLLDNYWCYLYERQVKYYKQQSSNMKSLCKTFADRAKQLYFTNTFLSTTPDTNEVSDQCPEPELLCLQPTNKPVLLTASSVQEGIKVKECIYNQNLGAEYKEGLRNGIFLGKRSYHQLTEQETADVQHWISDIDLEKIPPICLAFTRILKVNDFDLGIVYREGEHVIVRDADDNSKEWVTRISAYYVCGPVNGSYHLFFKGKFYAAKTLHGRVVTDSWTGQAVLIQKDYRRLCVYPLRLIDRKVMLYPADVSASSFLVIDPDQPLSIRDITIPYYPSIDDVVQLKVAGRSSPVLVLVKEINDTESVFQGHELRKIRGCAGRFSTTTKIIRANCSSVECQIPYRVIGDCIYTD